MNNNLGQKTKELAELISQTPEFEEFQQAVKALEEDEAALDILQGVQQRKQTVIMLGQTGLPISTE